FPLALFFLVVKYRDSGPQDTYQIPLGIGTGDAVNEIAQDQPQSVIAKLSTDIGPAILYDAAHRQELHQELLRQIVNNQTLEMRDGSADALQTAFALSPSGTTAEA